MSEKTEKLAAAYESLANTEGGKNLMEWVEKSANKRRKDAGRSQDTAYGELKFADGMEAVVERINQMRAMPKITGGKAS